MKFINFFKKNWVCIALFIILAGAFFVRTYNFTDWLYFKMDQSRDAFLIDNVYEKGPGYLPLLGARAGATEVEYGFLRLGPVFYYFQYLSALIFHSTEPPVLAYPDLFFSMLAIVLLYFFAKLYFSRKHSLMITAMYAFSFIIIQYSRFAWNPNSLQFFILLCFYGLLRFFNEENGKRKILWIVLWALGIIIGSQMHFFGFFGLVGVSGLFVLLKLQIWKKEKIKSYLEKKSLKSLAAYVIAVIMVFAIFYAPVIISDVKEGGKNVKNFIQALSSKPQKEPFQEKITKSISENLNYYCLVTTSQCYGGDEKKEIPAKILTVIIFLTGIILIARKLKIEKNQIKKDFIMLLAIWVGVYFILMIPVSFQLRPRFFIVVFAVPFILLGLIYEFLEKKIGYKKSIILASIITLGIIAWNSYGTYAWFSEQSSAQKQTTNIKRSLILKNKDGVTLGQLQKAADWIYARRQEGSNVYYYVKPEHVRPMDYLFFEKRDDNFRYFNMKINEDSKAQFFAITPAKNGIDPVIKKFKMNVDVIANQQFGQIMVYEINFPDRIKSQDFKLKESGSADDDRLYWKDVFNF